MLFCDLVGGVSLRTPIRTCSERISTLVRVYFRAAETGLYLAMGLIVLLMLVEWVDERRSIWERLRPKPVVVRWAAYYALIFALIILGKWGLAQFIYMQF
ncbi:MAG: hypothetical protein ACE5JP_15665 [Candidatus Bipolaricaulia bacterium]